MQIVGVTGLGGLCALKWAWQTRVTVGVANFWWEWQNFF